ncbi:hypothetical protein EDB92DRAFT_236047 [Lactarius akahatsu]|uniref:Uncharacterized protein n=1 Tax=Lactarius akahatsu TaxID=416441 RepID=A0AAD4LJF3_9AGAM|nr:hypothetical protein EDB92DRAFT_236047 [Lactarius akahatsu]
MVEHARPRYPPILHSIRSSYVHHLSLLLFLSPLFCLSLVSPVCFLFFFPCPSRSSTGCIIVVIIIVRRDAADMQYQNCRE